MPIGETTLKKRCITRTTDHGALETSILSTFPSPAYGLPSSNRL
jgi:hypothetical protein